MKIRYGAVALIIIAILILAGCMSIPATSSHLVQVQVTGIQPATPQPVGPAGARSVYGNSPIFTEQGGAAMHVNSGGSIKFASGSTLQLDSGSTFTGYVLQYGSTGKKIVCNTTTITGTGTLATGLATPSVVIANLGADANYDHVDVTTLNASATVTAKVWNSAATPVAAATGVPVNWCVIGTP